MENNLYIIYDPELENYYINKIKENPSYNNYYELANLYQQFNRFEKAEINYNKAL